MSNPRSALHMADMTQLAGQNKSTNGYVVECPDGTFSHSGGRSGACSYHDGVWRPLYAH